MSEHERQIYAELLANADALDALYAEFVGGIITPALTPRDKADAIRAAVSRQRASDGAGQRELWEGGEG